MITLTISSLLVDTEEKRQEIATIIRKLELANNVTYEIKVSK